ncbi:hypothetical protein [Rossellomorea aquimaris]|uniref:hypothetical protein n=1 Tax=Rossellomorea aquimaris TaxID=189382 RepID=UPI0011E8D8AD|nr:hypothetical protein [Rossellomorea aquimaris]TYS91404.1 hypothetical protein FZC88_04465 [Rossellomorea aquimaris]
MPNCYLFINEYILPRIFSSCYYDDFMVPCHNQSIFVSYQKPKKESVTFPVVEQMQDAPFLNQTHVSQIIHSMMSSLNETNTHHQSTERPSFDITLTTEDQPSIVLSRVSKPKLRKRRGKCPRLLSREVRPFERFNYIDPNNSIPQLKYQASAPTLQPLQKNNPSYSKCDNEECKEEFIEIKHEQEKVLRKETRKDIHQNDQNTYIKSQVDEPVSDIVSNEEKPHDIKKHEMKSMRPSHLLESDVTKQTYSAGSFIEDGIHDMSLKAAEKMKAVLHDDLLEDKNDEQLHTSLNEADKDFSNQSSFTMDTDTLQPGNSYDETTPYTSRFDNKSNKNVNEDSNIKSSTENNIPVSIPSAKNVKYRLNRTCVRAMKIVSEHKMVAAEFNFEILSSSPPRKEMKYKLNRTELRTKKIVDEYEKSADENLNSSLPAKEGNNKDNRGDHSSLESASDESNSPAPTAETHFDILHSASSVKEVKKDVKPTDFSPVKMKKNETKSTPSIKKVQSDILSSKSPGNEVKYKLNRTNNQVEYRNHKQKNIVKDEVKTTIEQDFDILHNNNPIKESKLQSFHQKTNEKVSKPVSPSSHVKDKNDFHTTILNKYFTLGDKINVYAGSKLLDQQGTFLTAGPDFFIWIDGDGYVRLQIISGGISIGQTKKKK